MTKKVKEKEAHKASTKEKEAHNASTKEKEVQKEKASMKEKETQKENVAQATTSQVTIDLEEPKTEHIDVEVEIVNEKEEGEDPNLRSEELESPFQINKMQKHSSTGPCKKQKSDKTTSIEPLALTEGGS